MFAECPHSLYLYRTACVDGAHPDAPVWLRRQYECCRMQTAYYYARTAVGSALREFFYYRSTDNVVGHVLRQLNRDRYAAGRGEAPAGTGFLRVLDPENAEGEVRALLANPFLPELLAILRKVRPIDRIMIKLPVMTSLADLTLCAAPVLAYRTEGKCRFLTFEDHASIDTVLSRYALVDLRLVPERVEFLRYDGTVKPALRLDFSAELDHIVYSARRMYGEEHPRTGDRSVCQRCRFRFCCGD
ncbi:MAG: hypothetical protein IJV89_02625 [Lentisphaeria bacterium]|nr:hypothetical protein [Lentisphaeria bacterium]